MFNFIQIFYLLLFTLSLFAPNFFESFKNHFDNKDFIFSFIIYFIQFNNSLILTAPELQ